MSKLVLGIGSNDRKYLTKSDGSDTTEYAIWKCMLMRCTKVWRSKHNTYTAADCSENFKSYTFFYEWCQNQIGFGNKDKNGNSWQLDKDLLVKGNKLYSENNCVFIPHRINSLLTKRDSERGKFPVGVCLDKNRNKFLAQCCSSSGKRVRLGGFDTCKDAFIAYKALKEQAVKDVANEYREQLDSRAYQALMQYEVNIDD